MNFKIKDVNGKVLEKNINITKKNNANILHINAKYAKIIFNISKKSNMITNFVVRKILIKIVLN